MIVYAHFAHEQLECSKGDDDAQNKTEYINFGCELSQMNQTVVSRHLQLVRPPFCWQFAFLSEECTSLQFALQF